MNENGPPLVAVDDRAPWSWRFESLETEPRLMFTALGDTDEHVSAGIRAVF